MEPILPGEREFTRSPFWVPSRLVFTDFVLTIEKPSMDLFGLNTNVGKEVQQRQEGQNLFLI